ncbi:hypothetical protein BY996DRAFT_6414150 [Phakopsora pachyrhizi]|uniref:Expressed protein n=1 Tax=Phakopsora pachyrhizi TaxID=170000 RepID=A0AAV0AY69_PHAPC|nr:hypothetical protein BY996DRAFT_6414150 [Phakopsora pachyrhizi]CAH7673004.1 expressed protein [Phakopsora pachyrhizi]
MDEHGMDHSPEQLRRLEQMIQSQFAFTDDDYSINAKKHCKKINVGDTQVEEKSPEDLKFSFKLLSSQKEPRNIVISSSTDEQQTDPQIESVCSTASLSLNRVLDVEDEPDLVVKSRRKKIEDVSVDLSDIFRMAKQLYVPDIKRPLKSYKIVRSSLKVPRSSFNHETVKKPKSSKNLSINLGIIDDIRNPENTPKPRLTQKNGVSLIVNRTSLITETGKGKDLKSDCSNKTRSRKRRRSRQKERRVLEELRKSGNYLPSKAVKMSCV